MSEVGKQSVASSTEGESGLLVGRHDYALDPKKRLTIPSEWRDFLGTVVYIGEYFYVVEFTFRGYRARAFRESYWRVDPARYCSVVDDPRYARDSYYRRRGGDTQ